MKNNKEYIEEVYKKYENVKSDEKYFNKRPIKKKIRYIPQLVASFAVFLIVMSFIVIQKDKPSNDIIHQEIETEEKINLSKVENFEKFYELLKEVSSNNYYNEEVLAESTTTDAVNSNKSSESGDFSSTNIQVEGVDEGDIVKTDGKYIYTILNNSINIIDITNPSEMKQVAKIDFKTENANFNPRELYINGDKLVVFGNYYSNVTVTTETNSIIDYAYSPSYKNKSSAIIYDIQNKQEPKEIRRVEVEGDYQSSRMIEDNIYFVTNKYINTSLLARNGIEQLKESDFTPKYIDTAKEAEEKSIGFNNIYYFDNIEQSNYLILTGFSLNNDREANIKTFLGAGENVFVSEKNMYIIRNRSEYNAETKEVYDSNTKILKFSLSNGNINYKAEADVPGYINNQFSMDENNGYFRIATTSGIMWNLTNDTTNSLYVLDENLKLVGKVDGLAKGERIYSVRYIGTKAYIVTFKQVDPLFVIDLSDNKNPKVLGELKIPGYSTYLHPYDEDHLIGFGYDTTETKTGVTTNGLKMSMFDISDLSNPKELFSVKVADKYSSSELSYNHKALLYSKEKNLIAFPVLNYLNNREYKAMVYNIDLEKGFVLRGEIKHDSKDYKNYIKRIIFANNVFYTLSDGEILASSMEDLKLIKQIDIN